MPWRSKSEARWGHAHFSKERAAEWDAATDFSRLPEHVEKQREATRASGRKKGLARLTRMAGLGVYVLVWFFFPGCASSPVRPTTAVDVASCKLVVEDSIAKAKTCREAESLINKTSPCDRLYHGSYSLQCKE
jgi:hypothetical protein